jgi:hypothetical protein
MICHSPVWGAGGGVLSGFEKAEVGEMEGKGTSRYFSTIV